MCCQLPYAWTMVVTQNSSPTLAEATKGCARDYWGRELSVAALHLWNTLPDNNYGCATVMTSSKSC